MGAYQGCLQSKKITVEKLTAVIERLEARLGNKSITVGKTCNENINGKGKDSRQL